MPAEKSIYMEKKQSEAVATPPIGAGAGPLSGATSQMRRFLLALAALVICFSVPLYRMAVFAWGDELYSYILLMPAVSWYLMRLEKKPVAESRPLTWVGALFLAVGAAALGAYFVLVRPAAGLNIVDYLSINMFAFFMLLMGIAGVTLGRDAFRAAAFPLGMLIFIVPVPSGAMEQIVTFLQYGSAIVAAAIFALTFSIYRRDGLDFALPGTPGLQVAPECSGIHSSWILLITSLLAGYLFLRSPRNRWILTLAVLPLALLRNGFRVFTIGELCVHIGPQMIDSPIHRKGGPLFFALSLIPFFLLLTWLRKREGRRLARPASA
jgi:exosortase C (VPDSG-CTERM-specific)